MELIRCHCNNTTETPSVSEYLQWQTDCKSATLQLFLLPCYLQPIGDRNNDARASHARRMKFMDIFFGFNHLI